MAPLFLYLLETDEPFVSRALECKLSPVAFGQQAVFLPRDGKFHAVAAFHLKGGIVIGGGGAHSGIISRVVVMIYIGPLGHHGALHREDRGGIVALELAGAFYNARNDNDDKNYEHADE